METDKEKKKKPLWKRILKWSGISFLLLLIAIILVPFLFKNQIIQLIKDEANANLNATLEFGEFDLTLLSTFPNLTLTINDLALKGKGEFEDVYLTQIKTMSVKLDFWKALFGSQYQVEDIYLLDPIINIKVLPDGKANYDIAIADTTATPEEAAESAPFKFALQHYKIENGDIIYDDQYYLTYIRLATLNHEGNVTIDDVIYTLNTTTKSGGMTFGYDGFDYLSHSVADIKCDLEIAMPADEMKITFKENEAALNALKLHFDGSMLMKDDFMDFDFTFNTLDQTFKSLLSIVPGAFTKDFDNIKTDGKIDLSGSLNGKYSETDMPGFNLITKIDNAWLKYPDLPATLKNINLDLSIQREAGPDLDNLIIDMKKLSLEFLENKLSASLYLTHPMSDPNITSNIKTYLNLAELKKVVPVTEGEDYSGIVTSDINLKGRLSSIEKEEYDKFNASGNLKIEQMNYVSSGLAYSVGIEQMLFEFSPQAMSLVAFDSKIGNSDLHANGTMTNYLAYFLKDETLIGNLNVSSNYMDMDQLMYDDGSSTTTETATTTAPVADSIPAEVFQIPGNIDFNLATSIAKLRFDSLDLTNVGGQVVLKDGIAKLNNLKMNIFDGNIAMNGTYQALNPKRAKLDFDYNIQNLDFKKSFDYFNTVAKYASIAKYCNGKFSTKMNLVLELDENYNPIYESMTGLGGLSSSEVKIENHPILDEAAKLLKLESFKNQTIQNLDLSFEFKEGKLWLKETPLKLGKINSKIVGTTSFTEELDYDWTAEIPKAMLGSNANQIAEGLLGKLNQAAGTNVVIPDLIPAKFKIGGTVTKPVLTSGLKDAGQDAGQNLVDQGKQIVKDKLSAEAKKLLEDAQKEADKILAEAKAQGAKLRNEADVAAKKIETEGAAANVKAKDEVAKQGEKLKQEGYKAAQKLVDDAKNPVAKLAAEKAAEKMRSETDKKVADLVSKGNSEADNAKATSDKNAQKLRDEADAKATGIENAGQTQSDKIMQTANDKVDKMAE